MKTRRVVVRGDCGTVSRRDAGRVSVISPEWDRASWPWGLDNESEILERLFNQLEREGE